MPGLEEVQKSACSAPNAPSLQDSQSDGYTSVKMFNCSVTLGLMEEKRQNATTVQVQSPLDARKVASADLSLPAGMV